MFKVFQNILYFYFTNISRVRIDKKMKARKMILPRRISSLNKTPIVFITDVVGVKYVPNPESQRQKQRQYQPEEKQGDYCRQGNSNEKKQQPSANLASVHLT
jgi:hypothetical protein